MNAEKEELAVNEEIAHVEEITDTAVNQSENKEAEIPTREEKENEDTDYKELLKADMLELSGEFSPGKEMDISDLKNPIRYGALRDLGLTPKEAYLASGGRKEIADNRSHLSSSVPKKFSSHFSEMPRAELDAARELFGELSDTQIRNLYKKVTQ